MSSVAHKLRFGHVLVAAVGLAACGGHGPTPGQSTTRIEFAIQPQNGVEGKRLASVRVTVIGFTQQIDTSAEPLITLQLNRTGGLTGDTSVRAIAGVADFQNLTIASVGAEYKLIAGSDAGQTTVSSDFDIGYDVRNVILLIADGWGYKHIEATRSYTGRDAVYSSWTQSGMSTYDTTTAAAHGNVGYDPSRAWADFDYALVAATDSAAAATAMYTGTKVANGEISSNGAQRLEAIRELAYRFRRKTGAVTSVPISHATPGAWFSHNRNRGYTYAIADEGLFEHPNASGNESMNPLWGGHLGPTIPAPDVIIGGGHPAWSSVPYVSNSMLQRLVDESGWTNAWTFVQRRQNEDGGAHLLKAAATATRLAGLFGGLNGNIEFRKANGTGHNRENPTLEQMTQAALSVLERKSRGFVLMVEGGAIDWAGHGNLMDETIGEMIDFDAACAAVARWVDDSTNGSSWDNTLVLVTGDHETGYLTAGPRVFPNRPLGKVDRGTLALEKVEFNTFLRASWVDTNKNETIDPGETVYWAWNSSDHANSLIPVYAKGVASNEVATRATGKDPVRGRYLDNTELYHIMRKVVGR